MMEKKNLFMGRKKFLVAVIALCMGVLFGTMTGCAAAPQVEDIYDRVVTLIEASYEVNTVFYGPGLPVYDGDSEYVKLNHVYYGFDQEGYYEYVMPQSKFRSEAQIKAAAERVYSNSFLNDVLYKTAFDGYAIEDGAGGAAYGLARYQTFSDLFCQSVSDDADGNDRNTLYTAMRIYDYSTMEVISLGRSDACKVSMVSWLEDSPETTERLEISLVLQDGQWFLDSFNGA